MALNTTCGEPGELFYNRKNPKHSVTWKFAVVTLKFKQGGFNIE